MKQCLTPMQDSLLQMMKWFDLFCRRNNLRYYAIGGTMLGAARHQGFIPWDDDLDVAMPREDYSKLQKMMENRIHNNYILETPQEGATDFCYPYAKLYDTSTTLIENCRKPLIRGIFIDIFPLDGIGNDYEVGIKWYRKVKTYYHLYLTRITSIRKGRSAAKNIAVFVSRLIPQIIINDVELRKRVDRMCCKYSFDKSKWGGMFLGNWGEREIMRTDIFGNPVEYDFEDMCILHKFMEIGENFHQLKNR